MSRREPLRINSFNPRSRTGSDSDLRHSLSVSDSKGFNPRSRTGSDRITGDEWNQIRVSIHAPARGATRTGAIGPERRTVSIHAPARGATRHPRARESAEPRFNPRSRTGSDRPLAASMSTSRLFQSTLPHGERLDCCSIGRPNWSFQSTLPHGERLWRRGCSLAKALRAGFREHPRPLLAGYSVVKELF